MNLKKSFLFFTVACLLQGCVFTKIVSVPMRAGAAVVSIVPFVGNSVHDSIDTAAEAVDALPI